jgi:hypothetical protein
MPSTAALQRAPAAASFQAQLLMNGEAAFTSGDLIRAFDEEFAGVTKGWAISVGAINTARRTSSIALTPQGEGQPLLIVQCHHEARLRLDDLRRAATHAPHFLDAETVLRRHTHHISVMAPSLGHGPDARYGAARLVTALASVIAQHPGCLALHFASGAVLAAPAFWRSASECLNREAWPLELWMSLKFSRHEGRIPGTEVVTCASEGLAAFTGCEVVCEAVPVKPLLAGALVYAAAHRLLARPDALSQTQSFILPGTNEPFDAQFAEADEDSGPRWVLRPRRHAMARSPRLAALA